MLKRSSLIFFVLTFFLACSPKSQIQNSTLAITQYEALVDERLTMAKSFREVAQENKLECRGDFFEVKYLKEEIKVLEAKLKGKHKISGYFKHLDYAKLPVAQAQFLKRYEAQLGDASKTDYDFSTCTDVPCIINTIYEKPDGVEGYAIYYWYLKMGHTLAFDNKIYAQASELGGEYNNKKFDFKSYLWDKDELYGFWYLSNALEGSFTTLTRLKEIQRLPRTATFEDKKENVCGLAWYDGYIALSDRCLELKKDKFWREHGEFYASVIHEMAHQVDYTYGVNSDSAYYSMEEEWKKEAGWHVIESVNTETGESKSQWQVTLESKKFITNYAYTKPQEHFAETMAYFRDDPDKTKEIIPSSTYELIKSKFYNNKAYDKAATTLKYSSEIDEQEKNIFTIVQQCLEKPSEVILTKGEEAKISNYGMAQNKLTARCLTRHGLDSFNSIIKSIKLNRVDGCRTFNLASGDDIRVQLEKKVISRISEHVKKALEDANYFKKLASFYQALNHSKLARESFVFCYGAENEESCYQAKVKDGVAKLIPPTISFSENYRSSLVEKFLDSNPYGVVKDATIKIYSNFIFASNNMVRETAEESFKACRAVPPTDQVAPLIKDFSPGENYVVSSLINCLNSDVSKSLQFIVSNLNTEVEVKIDQEKRIIIDLVKPIFISHLKDTLTKDIEEEKHMLKLYKEEGVKRIKNELVSDFSWVTSFIDEEKQKGDCFKLAATKIDLSLFYHLKEQEFLPYIKQEVCPFVIQSPELRDYINKNYLTSTDAAIDEILGYLNTSGRSHARSCLVNYPKGVVGDFLFSKKRVKCVEESWALLESRAVKKFQTQGLGSKFQYNETDLTKKLKPASQKLKQKVIEEELR